MPGLQPGLTRKDTQHFPILTMTKKLSMLYIPEILKLLDQLVNVKETKYGIYPRSTQALHRMPGLQPG